MRTANFSKIESCGPQSYIPATEGIYVRSRITAARSNEKYTSETSAAGAASGAYSQKSNKDPLQNQNPSGHHDFAIRNVHQ